MKTISYNIAEGHAELFYDSLANIVCICDTQKGIVQPYFLNLYKSRHYKGKTIQLDADVQNQQNNESTEGV